MAHALYLHTENSIKWIYLAGERQRKAQLQLIQLIELRQRARPG